LREASRAFPQWSRGRPAEPPPPAAGRGDPSPRHLERQRPKPPRRRWSSQVGGLLPRRRDSRGSTASRRPNDITVASAAANERGVVELERLGDARPSAGPARSARSTTSSIPHGRPPRDEQTDHVPSWGTARSSSRRRRGSWRRTSSRAIEEDLALVAPDPLAQGRLDRPSRVRVARGGEGVTSGPTAPSTARRSI